MDIYNNMMIVQIIPNIVKCWKWPNMVRYWEWWCNHGIGANRSVIHGIGANRSVIHGINMKWGVTTVLPYQWKERAIDEYYNVKRSGKWTFHPECVVLPVVDWAGRNSRASGLSMICNDGWSSSTSRLAGLSRSTEMTSRRPLTSTVKCFVVRESTLNGPVLERFLNFILSDENMSVGMQCRIHVWFRMQINPWWYWMKAVHGGIWRSGHSQLGQETG